MDKIRNILNNINYKKIVIIILLFNLIDLILTYYGLQAGYFIEGNELMNSLYEINPYLLILVKLLVTLFFAIIMFRFIDKLSLFIKTLLFIPLVLYSYVMVLHLIVLKLEFFYIY